MMDAMLLRRLPRKQGVEKHDGKHEKQHRRKGEAMHIDPGQVVFGALAGHVPGVQRLQVELIDVVAGGRVGFRDVDAVHRVLALCLPPAQPGNVFGRMLVLADEHVDPLEKRDENHQHHQEEGVKNEVIHFSQGFQSKIYLCGRLKHVYIYMFVFHCIIPSKYFLFALLCLSTQTHMTAATIIELGDKKPYLTHGDTAIRFSEGGPAYVLASSPYVRINYRGIKTSRNTPHLLDLHGVGTWQRMPCNASAYALCTLAANTGHVFPASATPLFTVNSPMQCANSKSKNMIHSAAEAAEYYYDFSACDVLDEGLDVVVSEGGSAVWIRRAPVSAPVYWTLILCTIFLIRTISLNLSDKLSTATSSPGDKSQTKATAKTLPQYQCIAVNAVILIVVLIEGDSHYVTAEDAAFYYISIVYIVAYLAFHLYHALRRWWQCSVWGGDKSYNEPRVFNLSAASLQLVITRLYCGAESPYAVAIIAMLLVRVWDKETQKLWMHSVTALADCVYVALLMVWGYAYDPLYLVPLVAFSKIVSDKMFYDV